AAADVLAAVRSWETPKAAPPSSARSGQTCRRPCRPRWARTETASTLQPRKEGRLPPEPMKAAWRAAPDAATRARHSGASARRDGALQWQRKTAPIQSRRQGLAGDPKRDRAGLKPFPSM